MEGIFSTMLRTLSSVVLLTIFLAALVRSETAGGADAPPDHQGSQKLITQDSAGAITLDARDASVHGATIRYEPAPEKNTVGYWTQQGDWVSWVLDVPHGGKFEVDVLQGCGKGSGGSEVEVAVGEETLKMVVEDTGHFQNFILRKIGTMTLTAGRHTLAIKAKTKPGLAVMDVRQVTLRPEAAKTEKAP